MGLAFLNDIPSLLNISGLGYLERRGRSVKNKVEIREKDMTYGGEVVDWSMGI